MHHVPASRNERPPTRDETVRRPASVIPLTATRRRRAFLRRLKAMSPNQRIEAAMTGKFSRAERALWASAYPEDVPLVNDEFEWIALRLADLD